MTYYIAKDVYAGELSPAQAAFIASLEWTFFITVPITKSKCDDYEMMRRWKLIEAHLCNRYLPKRWHKIEGEGRFQTLLAFEGSHKAGTRHCHLLMYVPEAILRQNFRHFILSGIKAEIQMLWNIFSPKNQQFMVFGNKQNCWQEFYPWESSAGAYIYTKRDFIQIGTAEPEVAAIYTMKSQTAEEREYNGWNFVTPPKYMKFQNSNTKAIKKQNRVSRKNLSL